MHRRATRTAVRDQYAGLGRRIVERLFVRAKIEYADDKLKGALPRLARASIDDVMASVGRGEMKASDVARAMYPDYKEERVVRAATPKAESGWFGLRKAKSLIFRVPDGKDAEDAIPIRGIGGEQPVRFAPDGGADCASDVMTSTSSPFCNSEDSGANLPLILQPTALLPTSVCTA